MRAFALLAASWVLSCHSQGTFLFEADHPRFGPKALTVDSRTGLIWLDLTASIGLSYNGAVAAMASGGQLEGFRHATFDEVTSLLTGAGVEPGVFYPTDPGFARIPPLLSFIGETDREFGLPYVFGVTGTKTERDSLRVVYINGGPQPLPSYRVETTLEWGSDTAHPTFGHWLVVTEPATITLLAVGTLCVMRSRNL